MKSVASSSLNYKGEFTNGHLDDSDKSLLRVMQHYVLSDENAQPNPAPDKNKQIPKQHFTATSPHSS